MVELNSVLLEAFAVLKTFLKAATQVGRDDFDEVVPTT
jgi:hypothetical protein